MNALGRLLVLVALAGAAGPASGQDLRYRTASDLEFGGALGALARLMPGGGTTRETTVVKGPRLRTDSGEEQSVIHDVAAGRFTTLDHRTRTWTSFGIEDATAMMERFEARLDSAAGSTGVPLEDTRTGARGTVEVRVATEDTGDRRTIHGTEARRVFVTVQFEGEVTAPEEQGDAGERQDAGTVVLLNDLWLAEPFPELQELAEAGREAARELVESSRGSEAAMGRLLAANPDLEVAMERQAEEFGRLEGMVVESVAYLVAVPREMELDRDAALAFEQESLGSQVARGAARAAVDQAREAVSGRLGGLFGRGRPAEPEPPPPVQAVLFRVRTRITEVERGTFPDELFEIPEGYTERSLEMP